jgi:hypothetical protein
VRRCQIWSSFWGLSFSAALHYHSNAKLKWQFLLLLLEVLYSAERWIVVP